jgi:hypothetical protein
VNVEAREKETIGAKQISTITAKNIYINVKFVNESTTSLRVEK